MPFLNRRVHPAFVVCLLLCGLASCTTKSCKQLNNNISEALVDNRITAEEAKGFFEFIKDPSNEFKDCSDLRQDNGQPNTTALLTFIKKNSAYIKFKVRNGQPPVIEGLTEETTQPLRAKLYLEASASMFPYDASSGKGLFKQAITQLLNPFENSHPGQTKLAVVNDGVYDLDLSYSNFINHSNLYADELKKGDSNFTDFTLIFKRILSNLTKGEVAILASDLIYSPIDKKASPAKVMAMGQSMMTNVFSSVADTTSLLILQLTADYNGKYYSESARAWVTAPSERPYYLCLMAHNATMHQLLADPSRYGIQRLPDLKNFWLFSKATEQTRPRYTVLLNDKAKVGSFRKSSAETTSHTPTIHELDGVIPDIMTKKLVIPVAVDLLPLYLPVSTTTDLHQYEATGPDSFSVSSVSAYSQTNGKPNGPQQMTHKLCITSVRPVGGKREVTIRMRRSFPQWISDSHTNNDSKPDTEKTFGLLPLLQGIEQAYNPTNQPTYFTLTLKLAK